MGSWGNCQLTWSCGPAVWWETETSGSNLSPGCHSPGPHGRNLSPLGVTRVVLAEFVDALYCAVGSMSAVAIQSSWRAVNIWKSRAQIEKRERKPWHFRGEKGAFYSWQIWKSKPFLAVRKQKFSFTLCIYSFQWCLVANSGAVLVILFYREAIFLALQAGTKWEGNGESTLCLQLPQKKMPFAIIKSSVHYYSRL